MEEVNAMIIELPKKFNYGSQAKVVDDILKIPSGISVRDFMYKLTIAIKGKKCWYCGKKLKKEEITMDHLYPQDLGGPTIPNNLAPTCAECNNQKGNLTEKQYRDMVKAPKSKKKELRSKFAVRNEQHKLKRGYYLPKEWITTRKIDNIIVTWFMNEAYMSKRYMKIESFYRAYGHLPHPIVVDRNNYLLDGFLVLMVAKNNNVSMVPTIVLENVEVVVNK